MLRVYRRRNFSKFYNYSELKVGCTLKGINFKVFSTSIIRTRG